MHFLTASKELTEAAAEYEAAATREDGLAERCVRRCS